MDGAEGVGHVQVRHGRQLLRQLRIVLGLALFKAGVLQQQDLARLERRGLGPGVGAHHVGGHQDVLPQQLAQPLGHGGQGQLGQGLLPALLGEGGGVLALLGLLLRPFVKIGHRLAQVGAGDDGGAVLQQIADGGQSRHDALVAGDGAVLVLGHVEVAAEQDPFAPDLHVPDSLLAVVHLISSYSSPLRRERSPAETRR